MKQVCLILIGDLKKILLIILLVVSEILNEGLLLVIQYLYIVALVTLLKYFHYESLVLDELSSAFQSDLKHISLMNY